MRVQNHVIAVASAGLVGALAAALAGAAASTIAHAYVRHGFYRTILYMAERNLSLYVLPVLAGVAAIAVVALVWKRLRGDPERMLARLLGVVCALAVFLRVGFRYNHSHFFRQWLLEKRDLLGLRFPEALFQWDVWKANLVIALAALAIGLLVWRMCRWALPESGGLGKRFWRALGRPVAAVLGIALVAAPLLGAGFLRRSAAGRQSILLVSLDTLRADHLGCYGYFRDTSPEMDQLAEEGFLFEWAICQSPRTDRSHMSTFTSLYPTAHGVNLKHRLADWRLTVAEYMREAGYHTAACTDGGYMRRSFGFDQGFERYDDFKLVGIRRAVPRVLRWLDDGLADGPFFLLLPTYNIHAPYTAPMPWRDMFTDPEYDGGFHPGMAELNAVRDRGAAALARLYRLACL